MDLFLSKAHAYVESKNNVELYYKDIILVQSSVRAIISYRG